MTEWEKGRDPNEETYVCQQCGKLFQSDSNETVVKEWHSTEDDDGNLVNLTEVKGFLCRECWDKFYTPKKNERRNRTQPHNTQKGNPAKKQNLED